MVATPMPSMRALLLPIKDLRNAKQRLAGALTGEQRRELAEAMLGDTVRAVSESQCAARVFVVTSYPPAMRLAANNGWEVLREEVQTSESASVDWASQICEARGITGLLRVPLDLPLLRGGDIDELLTTECASPGMVIVPSRDGTGTNALLRTPPTLFPSRFGAGSFAKHMGEGQRLCANVVVRRNARLEMDVDDEADLEALLGCDLTGTNTGEWLGAAGFLKTPSRPGG